MVHLKFYITWICFPFGIGGWNIVVGIVWNRNRFFSLCVRIFRHMKEWCSTSTSSRRFNSFFFHFNRENAGLLALTRVGSRRVVQISAGFMIFFSILGKCVSSLLELKMNWTETDKLYIYVCIFFFLGKFGAVFASIPAPIVAALYCLFFAYVGMFPASIPAANESSFSQCMYYTKIFNI